MAYLTKNFPEWRQEIEEEIVQQASRDVDWMLANALTRDILVGRILKCAIATDDDETVQRWYDAVEGLLAIADDELRDAILHEVPRAALDTAALARQSQVRSGPLLAAAIDDHFGDNTWRTKSDWINEPATSLVVDRHLVIYLFDGELLLHGRRYFAAEDNYPATRPFAKIPYGNGPSDVGAVLSNALAELAADTSVVEGQLDEFLDFVGGLEWRTLYTESRIVGVEIISSDGDVRVWAHRSEQHGDAFISPPIEPPINSNWHRVDDLGSSVLAAIGRSSTTGWVDPKSGGASDD